MQAEAFTDVEPPVGRPEPLPERLDLALPGKQVAALGCRNRSASLPKLNSTLLETLSRSDAVRSRDSLTRPALG
jgi:hypothetical protein